MMPTERDSVPAVDPSRSTPERAVSPEAAPPRATTPERPTGEACRKCGNNKLVFRLDGAHPKFAAVRSCRCCGELFSVDSPLAGSPPTREQIEAMIAAGRDEPVYIPTYTTASGAEPSPESGALLNAALQETARANLVWTRHNRATAKERRDAGEKQKEAVAAIRRRLSTLERDAARMREENARLRRNWWLAHGYAVHRSTAPLYGDDGEMSCNACLLDFKRAPIEDIELRLLELGYARAALSPSGEPATERRDND